MAPIKKEAAKMAYEEWEIYLHQIRRRKKNGRREKRRQTDSAEEREWRPSGGRPLESISVPNRSGKPLALSAPPLQAKVDVKRVSVNEENHLVGKSPSFLSFPVSFPWRVPPPPGFHSLTNAAGAKAAAEVKRAKRKRIERCMVREKMGFLGASP